MGQLLSRRGANEQASLAVMNRSPTTRRVVVLTCKSGNGLLEMGPACGLQTAVFGYQVGDVGDFCSC